MKLSGAVDSGQAGPSEQRVPPHLQHGVEPAARGGDQSGVHARAILLPVPELRRHPGVVRK